MNSWNHAPMLAQAQPHPGQGWLMRNPSVPPRSPCHKIPLPFPELKGPSLPPVLYWSLMMIFLPARAERG